MASECRGLCLCKATLGTDNDPNVPVIREERSQVARVPPAHCAEDERAAVGFEKMGERGGRFDDGNEEAAGLFGGLDDDAAPAGELRFGGGVAALGPLGKDGPDDVGAGFGALFEGPLEAVGADERAPGLEDDRGRGFLAREFTDFGDNAGLRDAGNGGGPLAAVAREQEDGVAGAHAEHGSEVAARFAVDRDGAVGEPPGEIDARNMAHPGSLAAVSPLLRSGA